MNEARFELSALGRRYVVTLQLGSGMLHVQHADAEETAAVLRGRLVPDGAGAATVAPRGRECWVPELAEYVTAALRERGAVPYALLARDPNWFHALALLAESPQAVRGVPSYRGSVAAFGVLDIAQVKGLSDGEAGRDDWWAGVFGLRDGRVAVARCGCARGDWNANGWGAAWVAGSLVELMQWSATADPRGGKKLVAQKGAVQECLTRTVSMRSALSAPRTVAR